MLTGLAGVIFLAVYLFLLHCCILFSLACLVTEMWSLCDVASKYSPFLDSDHQNTVRSVHFWSLYFVHTVCTSLWIKASAWWIKRNANVNRDIQKHTNIGLFSQPITAVGCQHDRNEGNESTTLLSVPFTCIFWQWMVQSHSKRFPTHTLAIGAINHAFMDVKCLHCVVMHWD